MKNIYRDNIRFDTFHRIVTPLVGKRVRELMRTDENNYIIDTTFPLKLKVASMFNVSVLVTTSKRVGYRRLWQKYPKKTIDNMWRLQKDVRNYDFVIENKSSIADLRADVDELISEMFKM